MIKWYCSGCGKTTYKKVKPQPSDEGRCSLELSNLRWKMSSGQDKDPKVGKNQMVHQWFDAEEYESAHGSLPTLWNVQQEYDYRQKQKSNFNDAFKEKYGQDLFLPNGKLNENYNRKKQEEPEESFGEELKEIKDKAVETFN